MCLAEDRADEVWARSLVDLARVEVFRVPRALRLVRTAAGLAARGRPLQCSYFHSPRLAREIRRLPPGSHDVAVGSLIRTADYLLDGPIPTLIDVQDLISLNYRRALPFLSARQRLVYEFELPRIEAYEGRVIDSAAACTLVGPVDLAEARARAPHADLRLLGNGVDADHFQRPEGARPHPGRLVFLGNLRTLSNRDMVRHLATEIMPRIEHAGAHLRVVGTQCPPEVAALREDRLVQIVGAVDDPRAHLWGAWATICPMRFGAGVANKVLESLAAGTPAVVTPMAAQALGLAAGEGVAIAEGPDELARTADAILGDEQRQRELGVAGEQVVRERFAWDRALAPLGDLLEGVAGGG